MNEELRTPTPDRLEMLSFVPLRKEPQKNTPPLSAWVAGRSPSSEAAKETVPARSREPESKISAAAVRFRPWTRPLRISTRTPSSIVSVVPSVTWTSVVITYVVPARNLVSRVMSAETWAIAA